MDPGTIGPDFFRILSASCCFGNSIFTDSEAPLKMRQKFNVKRLRNSLKFDSELQYPRFRRSAERGSEQRIAAHRLTGGGGKCLRSIDLEGEQARRGHVQQNDFFVA